MPRKLSIRTSTLLALVAIFAALAPVSVYAQSKEDQVKAAEAAVQKGDIEGAATAYCDLTKVDSTFAGKCRSFGNLVEGERKNDAQRIKDGKAALDSGDFDTAKSKFRAVKLNENKATAADYLNNKIPAAENAAKQAAAAQQQQQQQQAQQAIAGKVSQARDAFNRKDYEAAKAALAGVNTPEAQSLMQQITQAEGAASAAAQSDNLYKQKVSEGDNFMAQGKFSDAENSYRAAAGLKGSTPADLRDKIAKAESGARAALAGNVSGKLVDTSQQAVAGASVLLDSPSTGFRKKTTTDGGGNFRFEGVPAGSYSLAATKSGRLLSNQKISVAASQSAVAALVAAAAPPGGAAEGDALENGIRLFYKGSPDDLQQAELALGDTGAKGKKAALGNFYLGATRLARYYLAGEPKDQQSLYLDALDAFRQAKRVAGFKPPDEISPKIQKVWKTVR